MKKYYRGTEYKIDTRRYYPIHDLLELVKENLENKFGPVVIKKKLWWENIYVQGADGYVNKISTEKRGKEGQIWGRQGGQSLKSQLKSMFSIRAFLWRLLQAFLWLVLCVATLGIILIIGVLLCDDVDSGPVSTGTRANRAMLKALAEEIEKLVGK